MSASDGTPWYRFASRDQPTLLYQGPATRRWSDSGERETAEVQVRWHWRKSPAARVAFAADDGLRDASRILVSEPYFEFPNTPTAPPPAAPLTDVASGRALALINDGVGTFADVTAVELTAVNLQPLGVKGETKLEVDGWTIVISKHPDDATDLLEVDGGYGPTDLVRIRRSDGGTFDYERYEEIWVALWHFLGFVGSRLPGLALPVAFTSSDQATWTRWDCSVVEPWASPFGWFDHLALAPELPGLFDQWWTRWQDEFWRKVLQRATRMLLSANRSDPLDVAVTTGWTLLEVLGWATLVVELGWLTRRDFDKLPASAVVRLLLAWCGIPPSVPEPLATLAKVAAGDDNLADAAGAVGWVRNRLTHPPKNLDAAWPQPAELTESWRLELQWSELVMLRLLGYEGRFGNRCTIEGRWRGDVELVPWAPRPDADTNT